MKLCSLKSRYEKVLRSLTDFLEKQDVITYKELLAKDFQDIEILRQELEHGIIEKVAGSVRDGKCFEMKDYLKLLERVQSSFQQFCSIENMIKQRCVQNWNKYLTDVSDMEIGKKYREGAFLVQAVGCRTNVARIVKGPAVSTSLVTKQIHYLYKGRKIGMLYRLTENNLITLSTGDLYSDLKKLDVIDALCHWNLIDSNYGLSVQEESESKFYTFKEFIKRWEERVVEAELEDRYTEVLLMPNFENDLLGAFYFSDASDGERDRVEKLAELTTGILIELQADGYVKRVR